MSQFVSPRVPLSGSDGFGKGKNYGRTAAILRFDSENCGCSAIASLTKVDKPGLLNEDVKPRRQSPFVQNRGAGWIKQENWSVAIMKTTMKHRAMPSAGSKAAGAKAVPGTLAQLKSAAASAPAAMRLDDLCDKDTRTPASADPKASAGEKLDSDILAKDIGGGAGAGPLVAPGLAKSNMQSAGIGAGAEPKATGALAPEKDDHDPKSSDGAILRKKSDAVQRMSLEEEEPLQGKGLSLQRVEDEELLQGKGLPAQRAAMEEEEMQQ
jgi:hypothetical protein